MIKIEPIGESYYTGVRVTGHAVQGDDGISLACAGISAGIYVTLFNLKRGAGEANVKSIIKPGHTEINIITETFSSKNAIDSFLEFAKQVEKNYKGSVEIK
jgi:uncharacterized protein YsxB (DUF464 family)